MNRSALTWLVLVAGTFLLISCDQNRPEDDTNDRNTITFTVDDDGISYLYRHPSRGLHGADRLEDIPIEHRVAVIVVTSGRGSPAFDDRAYPVADLLDASAGDRATAIWITKKRFIHRNLASSYGHERAHGVRFWAEEAAQLAPSSDRAKSSDRALRILEDTPTPESDSRSKRGTP
jgi:hypothetical protein